jgi:hypothetical protein
VVFAPRTQTYATELKEYGIEGGGSGPWGSGLVMSINLIPRSTMGTVLLGQPVSFHATENEFNSRELVWYHGSFDHYT